MAQGTDNGSELELEPLGEPPPASTGPRMLVPLFVVPLLIVAVVVGLFAGISAIVGGEASPEELLDRVESGGKNDRWQAAASLADLAVRNPEALRDPRLAERIRRAFQSAGNDSDQDRSLRVFLAEVSGRIGDRGAVPMLIEALQQQQRERSAAGGDFASQELLYLVLNLGRLGDPRATAPIVDSAADPDAGVRKVVAVALGDLYRTEASEGRPVPEEVVEALRRLHQDDDAWVRMNAALSLADLNHADGLATLEFMLDRDNLKKHGLRFPDAGTATVASHDPAYEPILYALRALHRLAGRDPDLASAGGPLREAVARVSASDPNGELRASARDLLEFLDRAGEGVEIRDS